VAAGGPTRSASVRAGLEAVPPGVEVVVVHDAARPLAPPDVWDRVLLAVLGGADAAVPVVAVTDTIKHVEPDGRSRTLDRSRLVAVQTPQAFRAEILRRAHAGAPEATDDAGVVEAIGGRVDLVEGHPGNLKITDPADLLVAAALLAAR
jgi:2-C-methyl-D-erythritol 4-phosphate cytidylyltransferase